MHAAVLELVQAADVVEMAVGGHRDHGTAFDQGVDRRTERSDAVREVDHEVGVAPRHVPDVRDQQLVDVRLPQACDAASRIVGVEPRMRHGQVHHERSAKKTAPAVGRRQCSLAIDAL